MKKLFATVIKEWILLRRDMAGLALLIFMPAIMIVVMALIQDAPFRDYQEFRFDLLVSDNDHGSLSKEIKQGLRSSKNIRLVDSIGGKPVTDNQLMQLLEKGNYKIGIIIPAGATAEIVNAANLLANDISEKIGLSAAYHTREVRTNKYVRLYFDPVTKPTFRASVGNALDKYITYTCSNMLVQRLSKLGGTEDDTTAAPDLKKIFEGIGLREEMLVQKKNPVKYINSVQHNVPAWAIFGMFFIVVPIAGHIIKERTDGSLTRIQLIPSAQNFVSLGGILFYTLITTVQFWLMMCIGVWLMPLLDLPSLFLGAHPLALIPISIVISFTATCFGYFTGAMFKTTSQALPFGAVSIVILAAMGGMWVPVDLLPDVLQKTAKASPLHWALDAVHQIILRNGNLKDVVLNIVILLFTGIVLWLVSVYQNKKENYLPG